ncbi:MAG: hypothetical protein RBU23_12605 [Candidatus Auribacterota bacterium]|jgi:hypothetical protein|nr:hypothetical protein [Candidatus Auribacterota bacterium]
MISDKPAENLSNHPVPVAGSPLPVDEEPQSSYTRDKTDHEHNPQPDEPAHEGKEPSMIPYKRFKEVIGERNKLRDMMDQLKRNVPERENPYNAMYSDDELNMLFRDNPVEAAKTVFSQIMTHVQEVNRVKDQSLAQAIQRYPELTDPNCELTQTAQSILNSEIPDLRSIPQGTAIAAEMAAARYYKDQYQQIARKHGINLQSMEATRNANLRSAHMEHNSHNADRSCGQALSAEEQRVAKLMGVAPSQYAAQKSSTNANRRQ